MIHYAVVERYARTLLLAGTQTDQLKSIDNDIKLIKSVLATNKEFQVFIKNPVISKNDKESVIKKSFSGKVSALSIHFIQLLIRKNRIDLLSVILDEFQNALNTHYNIVKGTIYSVTPLNDSQLSHITSYYEKRDNSTHVFDNEINKTLIGGFVVRVGDRVEDFSLRNKLEHLKNKLLA